MLQNVDGCASSPCRNGGFCKNNLGGYECHCRSGYVDRHCQTKLNECENTICPPDSICVDDGIAHHCVCANGFTGKWLIINFISKEFLMFSTLR